ncbi:MAG TPA: glycosyltransferase [Acidimicrobiales bacterium]|nr:glycosyltransferase [Acidimicrobiales bacterium]
MSRPSISAIVPTWNEERWLPSLLTRLQSQADVGEIIVADNESDDNTAVIARSRGCAVVKGGLPAVGKNAGARAATGEVLLFVDADVGVGNENVAYLHARFSDPSCNLVYFRLLPHASTRSTRARNAYRFLDSVARTASRFNRPGLSAPLIAVRAEIFHRVGGFDEGISAAEDAEFIGRVARVTGGVEYARHPPLEISARRLSVEGSSYAAKSVLWATLRIFGSKASVFGYRWARYPAEVAAADPITDIH